MTKTKINKIYNKFVNQSKPLAIIDKIIKTIKKIKIII